MGVKFTGINDTFIYVSEKDKYLQNNANEEEYIIAYLDLHQSTDTAAFVQAFTHKNLVIRYAFFQASP